MRENVVSETPRRIVLLAVIAIVVLAVAGWRLMKLMQPREHTLTSATITKLDVTDRTAEVEFIHPKSGQMITVAGVVPEGCDIQINGAPATMADLRIGDIAEVRGMIYPDRSVEPIWVRVRRASATTQPASPDTPPAGADSSPTTQPEREHVPG